MARHKPAWHAAPIWRAVTHQFPIHSGCLLELSHAKLLVGHRFYAEEAFSFHVQQQLPDTLRVLDMQDMHALRQGKLLRTKI